MANENKHAEIIYNVIGADASALAAGLYLCGKGAIIPKADDQEFLFSLIKLIKQNCVEAVYVGTDPELHVIGQYMREIEEQTSAKIFVNPIRVVKIARDKWNTFRFLKYHGFACPDSALPLNLQQFLDSHNFPVVVKPREGFGAKHFYITNNRAELDSAIISIKKIGWNPIIQEYLGGDQEFTTGVLVDKSTKEIISSISIRKYLKFGQTYRAFIDDFKEIRSISEKVALVIGAAGAINIQSKNYKGTNKIFEINPRFSATCIMRAHAGINEPDLLFRNMILGESAKFRSYKKMVCMRYWEEICVEDRKYRNILKTRKISTDG